MTTPSTQPPIASRIPAKRLHHGDTVMDDYAWLAEKTNPDVLAYLRAENAYTEAAIEGLAGLRETIFDEIKGRTQQSDLSVPVRKGGWWYYSRTVEGQQYRIQCRRAAGPDGTLLPTPPTSAAASASRCGSRICAPARCSPTRSQGRTTAWPGPRTARSSSTPPWTTPGGRTGPGGM